jgi:hypothetical protein
MVCSKKNRLNKLSFLFFIFSIFNLACENDVKQIKTIGDIEKLPTETLNDAEIFYSDSAQIVAKLNAKKINHYIGKRSYTVMPKGINIIFYNSLLEDLKAEFPLFKPVMALF